MSRDEQNTDADNTQILRVFSNLYPSYEVLGTAQENQPNTEFFNYSNLDIPLSGQKNEIISKLKSFAEQYKQWIVSLNKRSSDLIDDFAEAVNAVISRCDRFTRG